MTSMAISYNQARFSQNLLSKYKKCSPSFTVNLYDDHWSLNKGPSKFLYTQPVSGLLDEVRALRIPVDFIEIFDMAHVPYYEGCMIVESIDHRKPRSHNQQSTAKEPECIRVVLQPNAESFYADLCLLNAKNGGTWTDQEALEVESNILNATCPPLCLEPDVNLTRIVNAVVRASTPSESVVLKRKQVHEPEEDENDKAKRAKLWSQYMHPHNGKPTSQARKRSMFDILNEIAQKDERGVYSLKWKQPKPETAAFPPQGQPQNNHTFAPPNAVKATPPSTSSQDDQKPKPKPKVTIKKPDPVEMPAPPAPPTKVKQKPVTSANAPAPAPAPSPVPDHRKVGPGPGISRTPIDTTSLAAGSPHPPLQFQQPPQPSTSPHPPGPSTATPPVASSSQLKKRGTLKKPEDQTAQPATQPQSHPPNPMDPPTAAWQPPIPSAQYLSQSPSTKKKQPAQQQPQQSPPFHTQTPVPGFAGNAGFPQNPAYKNTGGMVQNPNMNPNRGSPMAHNQPLLSRDPLPPHSQSPHPPSQQSQQAPAAPQHPMPHPSHQYNNMHLSQNRYSPAMQAQAGHHPQPMAQHPMPQQHHNQPTNTPRSAPGQHDPSQPMIHPQMQYNPMAYPYQMHMQGMMNGVRMANMPGAQAAGGQYMAGPAWRIAAGRGGGPPMTTIPMHNAQFQQQQMLAAMSRAQQAQQAQAQQAQQTQQAQPQGQGR